MCCAYTRHRFQVSICRTIGLLVSVSRTIANFIVWSFMQRSDMALALPSRFKELYDHYMKVNTEF